MNERDKKEYLERYKQAKEKGVPFFTDIVYKDAIASLVIFLILWRCASHPSNSWSKR